MNYIAHLNAAQTQIYEDNRLNPSHISMYLAIFFYWNQHHFPENFYANRKELMQMAKVGSKSTYHRLIKQLKDWGYIEYHPSKNPKAFSTISLSQIQDKSGTLMGRTRSIYESYCPKSVPLTLYIKHIKHTICERPKSQLEVLEFFKSQKYPLEEAFKFFNHYQATGWKIGGDKRIENWKAAADNWVIKAEEFKARGTRRILDQRSDSKDYLLTPKTKNYAEPL